MNFNSADSSASLIMTKIGTCEAVRFLTHFQ